MPALFLASDENDPVFVRMVLGVCYGKCARRISRRTGQHLERVVVRGALVAYQGEEAFFTSCVSCGGPVRFIQFTHPAESPNLAKLSASGDSWTRKIRTVRRERQN